jgi:microcompartment protein CcmL/EutN
MHRPADPALALVELGSIARAMRTGDTIVKRAPVRVALTGPVSPGKYLILWTGDEASVEESWRAGVEDAAEALVDQLLLPGVHRACHDAVFGQFGQREGEGSLGVLELGTVAATLLACDAACKTAGVTVLELRLADGIGGKGVFTLWGELSEVQAAVAAPPDAAATRRALVGREVIARPDPAFPGGLVRR